MNFGISIFQKNIYIIRVCASTHQTHNASLEITRAYQSYTDIRKEIHFHKKHRNANFHKTNQNIYMYIQLNYETVQSSYANRLYFSNSIR